MEKEEEEKRRPEVSHRVLDRSWITNRFFPLHPFSWRWNELRIWPESSSSNRGSELLRHILVKSFLEVLTGLKLWSKTK